MTTTPTALDALADMIADEADKAAQITDWLNRHPTVTLPIELTDEGIAETARQYHAAMDRDHGVAIALNRKWDREHL